MSKHRISKQNIFSSRKWLFTNEKRILKQNYFRVKNRDFKRIDFFKLQVFKRK